MTPHPAGSVPSTSRFPGFDAMSQIDHWDEVTAKVVSSRLDPPGDRRFFDLEEYETVTALVEQLLDLDHETSGAITGALDARLAAVRTDGWHYENMPEDTVAWRRALAGLKTQAEAAGSGSFAELTHATRTQILEGIRAKGSDDWHGMPASRLWDLWLRYACTAYYARPDAWNEIGFPGPAYPRGYKNSGIDAREPFEVADAEPQDDPAEDQGESS